MNLNLFCPVHLTNYLPVMLAANDTEIFVQVADIKKSGRPVVRCLKKHYTGLLEATNPCAYYVKYFSLQTEKH